MEASFKTKRWHPGQPAAAAGKQPRTRRWAWTVANYLSLGALILGFTALVGHASGRLYFFTRWEGFETGMAPNTAAALVFVSLAVFLMTMRENK